MLVITDGSAEITFVLRADGDTDNSTFSIGCNGITGVLSTLTDACEAYRDAFTMAGSLMAGLSSEYTFVSVEGRTAPDGTNFHVEVAVNEAGGGGPDPLPVNCAALIKKRTAFGGRANRGRLFIPGMLGEDSTDAAGNLVPATLSSLQDAIDVFFGALEDSDFEPVLFHNDEIRNPALPPPAMMANPDTTPTLLTSMLVDGKLATQRRRMR